MFDVLTIGTATRDVFLRSHLFRSIRDPQHLKAEGFPTGEAECFALGAKLEVDEIAFTTGGGAANTSVTFSRLGLRTGAFLTIGDDGLGDQIVRDIEREGVNVFSSRIKKGQSGYSTILLDPHGERTVLVYRGVSGEFSLKNFPFEKLKGRWAYIVPGSIPFEFIEKVIDELRRRKFFIVFNPSQSYLKLGIQRLSSLLRAVSVFIVNREEAAYFTGVSYDYEREIFRALDALVPGIAVMTDGSRGAFVSDGTTLYHSLVFKEQTLLDRTGAGDAFGSGFVAGLMLRDEKFLNNKAQTDNVIYALQLASANATSVVERIGAQAGILTRKRFEEEARFRNLIIKVRPL